MSVILVPCSNPGFMSPVSLRIGWRTVIGWTDLERWMLFSLGGRCWVGARAIHLSSSEKGSVTRVKLVGLDSGLPVVIYYYYLHNGCNVQLHPTS